ncbi:hypothetical protein H311_00618 [Anncaliia algerae PRA109]|nr:hypothetical protein H311_00618 [Anncaliia algerae PRA109]
MLVKIILCTIYITIVQCTSRTPVRISPRLNYTSDYRPYYRNRPFMFNSYKSNNHIGFEINIGKHSHCLFKCVSPKGDKIFCIVSFWRIILCLVVICLIFYIIYKLLSLKRFLNRNRITKE